MARADRHDWVTYCGSQYGQVGANLPEKASEGTDNAKRRLEEYDALKVSRLLARYHADGTCTMTVGLPKQAIAFGAFVKIEVLIPARLLRDPAAGTDELLSIAVAWPPSDSMSRERRSINVTQLSVTCGDQPISSAMFEIRPQATVVVVDPVELSRAPGDLVVTVVSPSLFFLEPGVFPFQRYILNLDVQIGMGAEKVIVYLDHGADISLRCRMDNSVYHSLAYGALSGGVRKIGFFERNTVLMRYRYGTSDRTAFQDLARPALMAALGALAGALTLMLLRRGQVELAAVAFALLLGPPFLQVFRGRGALYSSSDIVRSGASQRIGLVAASVYIPLFVIDLIVLTKGWHGLAWIYLNMVGMVIFVLAGVALLFLVNHQVIPRYFCDNCAKWIKWDKHSSLHLESRRTLCRECWVRGDVLRIEEGI